MRARVAFWLYLVAGITVFATWFWGAWATTLGIGATLIGSALIGSAIVPKLSGILILLGGVVAVVGLWSLQFTTSEISLDDSSAQIVLYGGMLVFAVGQTVLGLWMAREEVFEESEPMATA